jgi:hypothetical protein
MQRETERDLSQNSALDALMSEARCSGMFCKKASRNILRFGVWTAFAMLLLAPSVPASAHRQATDHEAPVGGISIPNIVHGQMAIIAAHKAAILDLAERQIPTDPTMRRLQSFINLQFFTCMWGIIPGSLRDEDSPFNECTHAYLAATRALLSHLQEMTGGDRTAVRILATTIEQEMLDERASLVICRYSDEPFNTAEVIGPHWSRIPYHLPSLVTFAGLALTIVGCARMAVRKAWPS